MHTTAMMMVMPEIILRANRFAIGIEGIVQHPGIPIVLLIMIMVIVMMAIVIMMGMRVGMVMAMHAHDFRAARTRCHDAVEHAHLNEHRQNQKNHRTRQHC